VPTKAGTPSAGIGVSHDLILGLSTTLVSHEHNRAESGRRHMRVEPFDRLRPAQIEGRASIRSTSIP
jgi:hypothetical protein